MHRCVVASLLVWQLGCGGDETPVSVKAGGAHTCALMSDGSVRCWGAGAAGQLGHDSDQGTIEPTEVEDLSDAAAISLGHAFSCALRNSGAVVCWGAGERGQLGNGAAASSLVPVEVAGIGDAVQLSTGEMHACAVLSSGEVRCWGANDRGQLGTGSQSAQQYVPATVTGLVGVVEVSAAPGLEGIAHSCARTADGAVWCWGDNTAGQLGDGSSVASSVPVRTSFEPATALATLALTSCALVGDGALACVGLTDPSWSALDAERFTSIAGGPAHGCVRTGSGAVHCFGFGNNDSGELGAADPDATVAAVPLELAVEVAAGGLHSCALLEAGIAQCWGENNNGRIGDGSAGGQRFAPATVVGLD